MKTRRLGRKEFQRLIRIGHGHPILFLLDHDPGPYFPIIENACLRDLRYDRQVEDDRTAYSLDLIRLSGNSEYLKQRILDQVAALKPNQLSHHLFQLAREFARQGSDQAAAVIRKSVANLAAKNDYWNIHYVLALDGLPGLDPYFSSFCKSKTKKNEWLFSSWVDDLEEREGELTAWEQLRVLANDNRSLQVLLEGVTPTSELKNRIPKTASLRVLPDYDHVRPQITSKSGISRYLLAKWGEQADEVSLRRAAIDLIGEANPEVKKKYLQVFRNRVFPLSPKPLIEMLSYSDVQTVYAASSALAHVSAPQVRAKALEMANTSKRFDLVVPLFHSNFQTGDFQLILRFAKEQKWPLFYHWMTMSALKLIEKHCHKDAAGVLLELYFRCPCSFCRSKIVKLLIKLESFPEDIRMECCYDCSEETRRIAKGQTDILPID